MADIGMFLEICAIIYCTVYRSDVEGSGLEEKWPGCNTTTTYLCG